MSLVLEWNVLTPVASSSAGMQWNLVQSLALVTLEEWSVMVPVTDSPSTMEWNVGMPYQGELRQMTAAPWLSME